MNPPRPPARACPKISTMPRRQSESAHYLDIYRLTVEKKRLQQELAELENRQRQVQGRLEKLDGQIQTLKQGAETWGDRIPIPSPTTGIAAPQSRVYPPPVPPVAPAAPYETLTLEY